MIRINLLAEARPTRRKRGVSALGGAGRLNLLLLIGAAVLGLMVVLVRWWMLSSAIHEQEGKIQIAQAEVTRLESILKEVKDFEDKKARLQRKVDLINQLKQNQRGPVRLMDEVSNALPDLLWLERMECKGNSIGLEGKALNPNAVANLLLNLKRVPSFQEPKVQVIEGGAGKAGAALYSFRLSFVFTNLDKTQAETAPAGGPAPGSGSPGSTAPGPEAPAGGQAPKPGQ